MTLSSSIAVWYNPHFLVEAYPDRLQYHAGQMIRCGDGRRFLIWPEQCPIINTTVLGQLTVNEASVGVELRSLDEPEEAICYRGQKQLSRRNPLFLHD